MFARASLEQSNSGGHDMERRAAEQLVERWLNEAICKGNVAIFDELLSLDVRDLSGAVPTRGRETFKLRARAVYDAFAELEPSLDALVIEGEQLAWRWSLKGLHRGVFAGVAASGRRVTLRGVNFQRIEQAQVVEHWTLADMHGLLQALKEST
jgi:predicted ester cyclase